MTTFDDLYPPEKQAEKIVTYENASKGVLLDHVVDARIEAEHYAESFAEYYVRLDGVIDDQGLATGDVHVLVHDTQEYTATLRDWYQALAQELRKHEAHIREGMDSR